MCKIRNDITTIPLSCLIQNTINFKKLNSNIEYINSGVNLTVSELKVVDEYYINIYIKISYFNKFNGYLMKY